MIRKRLLGVAILACVGLLSSCQPQELPRSDPATTSIDAVTSAHGWTLDNKQRARLADHKGKVVVLDFYATWCEPCRFETPDLVHLQQQYDGQGLQVIGLNVGGEDDLPKVPAFVKEFGIQYPLAVPDPELADACMGSEGVIPQALVFDRNGKLLKRFVGYTEESGRELERTVQAALAKQ